MNLALAHNNADNQILKISITIVVVKDQLICLENYFTSLINLDTYQVFHYKQLKKH
jgi:hypothetical protein